MLSTNTLIVSTDSANNTIDTIIPTNNCRIPNGDELRRNYEAIDYIIEQSPKDLTNKAILCLFNRPVNEKGINECSSIINRISTALEQLLKLLKIPLKKRIESSIKLKREYNICVHLLIGRVPKDSILNNLLSLNDQLQFLSKKDPSQRERHSMYDDKLTYKGLILHADGPKLIVRGLLEFDKPEDCLSAVRALIENSLIWKEIEEIDEYSQHYEHGFGEIKINIGNKITYLRLKIHFLGTEYYIWSNSSRLRHILCNGKPPRIVKGKPIMNPSSPNFNILYPIYAEFLRLVEVQILTIINNSFNNPDCPYTTISCCRITPICNKKTVCLKNAEDVSKLVVCGECNMDLCSGGCGRIYHGNTPCEISLDEASEALIQLTTKRCPNNICGLNVEKDGGCNHMTCQHCRTEFCWTCGLEMPKNASGRYDTVMHFNPVGVGVGITGGCNQFSN
jgi:hypothetical protein